MQDLEVIERSVDCLQIITDKPPKPLKLGGWGGGAM